MDDDVKLRSKDIYKVHTGSLYPSNFAAGNVNPQQPQHHHSNIPPVPSIVNLSRFEWKTGRWGNCSACGSAGKRLRTVRCTKMQNNYELRYVDDSYCDAALRPVNMTSCAGILCPYWNTGPWSECGDTCEMNRQVVCQNDKEQLDEAHCSIGAGLKPVDRRACCHIKWRSVWTQVRDRERGGEGARRGERGRERGRVTLKRTPN